MTARLVRLYGHFARIVAFCCADLALAPTSAFAHASDRGHVLLLPTGYYLVGGACAVAASFAVLTALRPDWLQRTSRYRLPLTRLNYDVRLWTSGVSFALLALLITAGLFGSRDPLSNPLPLAVWTCVWIGLVLVQGSLGNVWYWLTPWYAPERFIRRLLPAVIGYPRRLAYWPAVVLFAAFAWFELVDPAPDDPYRLALATAAYAVFTLAAVAAFGFDPWTRRAEFMSVFFRLISRLSITDAGARPGPRRKRAALCLPGAKLAAAEVLPVSGTLFLLLSLASVSFDGFSKTFAWLGAVGVNPLELPGRTALQATNTVGLGLMFAVLSILFFLCVGLGRRLAGGGDFSRTAGLLVWSLVPIALAYHFAHYLTALLVNGQYALVALSDPFGLGWNIFGTAHRQVSAGIAMGSGSAHLLWNLQAGAIIAGHVLAVVIAHMLVGRLHVAPRRTMLAELPLTVLMVGYTVFGLWLLSTPTAG